MRIAILTYTQSNDTERQRERRNINEVMTYKDRQDEKVQQLGASWIPNQPVPFQNIDFQNQKKSRKDWSVYFITELDHLSNN